MVRHTESCRPLGNPFRLAVSELSGSSVLLGRFSGITETKPVIPTWIQRNDDTLFIHAIWWFARAVRVTWEILQASKIERLAFRWTAQGGPTRWKALAKSRWLYSWPPPKSLAPKGLPQPNLFLLGMGELVSGETARRPQIPFPLYGSYNDQPVNQSS